MGPAAGGLKEAMNYGDSDLDDVLNGRVGDVGRVSTKMRVHLAGLASCSGQGVYMAKRTSDSIIRGPIKRVDEVLEEINLYFKCTLMDIVGSDEPENILCGLVYTMAGACCRCYKLVVIGVFLDETGIKGASSVGEPLEKSGSKDAIGEPLPPELAKNCRKATAMSLYVGRFQPECKYAIITCGRGMSAPMKGDWRRLTRSRAQQRCR